MGLRDAHHNAERDRQQRRADGKSDFNADKNRHIRREYLGWVCYVGSVDGAGDFRGKRVGVTSSEGDAEAWLNGKDDVRWDIPADPAGNLVDTMGSQR